MKVKKNRKKTFLVISTEESAVGKYIFKGLVCSRSEMICIFLTQLFVYLYKSSHPSVISSHGWLPVEGYKHIKKALNYFLFPCKFVHYQILSVLRYFLHVFMKTASMLFCRHFPLFIFLCCCVSCAWKCWEKTLSWTDDLFLTSETASWQKHFPTQGPLVFQGPLVKL